jgi:2-haloacid dehalogenase
MTETHDGKLTGIRACVFDAYGTLFDFASAAAGCADVLGEKTGALTAMWRDKQLQYTWLRTLQGAHADFWTVTRDALEYALDALDIRDLALADRLMSLYLNLKAFPEVPETLRRLKSAGLKIAMLSNGTPQMLEAVVSNAGLGELFDDVISVEAVGVFKTHPKVYQLAVERLGVAPQEIAFQSSNAWDAYAASAFGMRVVWCNRYGQRPERLPGKPDRQVRTLADLIPILGL